MKQKSIIKDNQTTEVHKLTTYIPIGLLGLFYWHGVIPIRGLALKNALQKIVEGIGKQEEAM